MAAFTAKDPNDRDAFDAHMAKVRTAPDATNRAVISGGRLVGSIAAFVMEGETEVTYWIDRAVWGEGIAGQALALLLDTVPVRPVDRSTAFPRGSSQPASVISASCSSPISPVGSASLARRSHR